MVIDREELAKMLKEKLDPEPGLGKLKAAFSRSKYNYDKEPTDDKDISSTWVKQEAGYRIYYNRETDRLEIEYQNCTPSEAIVQHFDELLYLFNNTFDAYFMEKFLKENV